MYLLSPWKYCRFMYDYATFSTFWICKSILCMLRFLINTSLISNNECNDWWMMNWYILSTFNREMWSKLLYDEHKPSYRKIYCEYTFIFMCVDALYLRGYTTKLHTPWCRYIPEILQNKTLKFLGPSSGQLLSISFDEHNAVILGLRFLPSGLTPPSRLYWYGGWVLYLSTHSRYLNFTCLSILCNFILLTPLHLRGKYCTFFFLLHCILSDSFAKMKIVFGNVCDQLRDEVFFMCWENDPPP